MRTRVSKTMGANWVRIIFGFETFSIVRCVFGVPYEIFYKPRFGSRINNLTYENNYKNLGVEGLFMRRSRIQ